MHQCPQEIYAAIPLLVVVAGDKSLDCEKLMKELCGKTLEINCKNFDNLEKACRQSGIETPDVLFTRPVLCESVSHLIQMGHILKAEKYHFFLRCFGVLVFIDNSKSNDINTIQSQVSKFPGLFHDRCSFVIFKADESSIEYHSETTCLCFDHSSEVGALSCVKEFLGRTCAVSACRLLELQRLEQHAIHKLKVNSDFAAVCGDIKYARKQLRKCVKQLDPKDNEWIAACYEMSGMLDHRGKEGKKYKLIPNGNLLPSFQNFVCSEDEPNSVHCFLHAAGLYNKTRSCELCVSCGIRMILDGCRDVSYPIAAYIEDNVGPNMRWISWEFVQLLDSLGMCRKSALIAWKFSRCFAEEDFCQTLRMFAMDRIVNGRCCSASRQLVDLFMPMFTQLINSDHKVSVEVRADLTCRALSLIGPSLDRADQERLFKEMSQVRALQIELPIVLGKPRFMKLPYDICDENEEQKKEVFIYSYLPKKARAEREICCAVGQIVTIMVDIFNPFAIELNPECGLLANDMTNIKCRRKAEPLKPERTSRIYFHVIPTAAVKFNISSVEFWFYGARQVVPLSHILSFSATENIPRYTFKTDLPLSASLSLYHGETYDFHIWIRNSGNLPITELTLAFRQAEIVRQLSTPVLPLMPAGQLSIRYQLTADRAEKVLAFSIITRCANVHYKCCQFVKQDLTVLDSLETKRIFLLKFGQDRDKEDNITVGYEITNDSDCTFKYEACVSEKKITGLLGAKDKFLLTAEYSLDELRTDGSDAEKNRVVALAKIAEAKLQAGLSPEQRAVIAKCASIMQRLEKKWAFTWSTSSTRRGVLMKTTARIDDDLYRLVDSPSIKPNLKWKDKVGNPVTQMQMDNLYNLFVDFKDALIRRCELVFTGVEQDKHIFWQGELRQMSKEGKSAYMFTLCFTTKTTFPMKIVYTPLVGIDGSKSFVAEIT